MRRMWISIHCRNVQRWHSARHRFDDLDKDVDCGCTEIILYLIIFWLFLGPNIHLKMGNHDDVDSEMDVCGNVDKDVDHDDGRDNDVDLCDGDDDDEEDDDDANDDDDDIGGAWL